jgi:HPt (histidine-containing phosphotransfer) domain-containing protein
MNQPTFTVVVRKDLAALVPQFLSNRELELAALTSALERSDFSILKRIAHRMKGLGNSYGFNRITNLGMQIEDAAKAGKSAELKTRISEYAEYLAKLEVRYT